MDISPPTRSPAARRRAHPARRLIAAAAATAALICGGSACANGPALADAAAPLDTGLDAELFYRLLVGELQIVKGEPGAGFSIMLDAARRTHRPELFRHAVEIALQARSGEAALQAARAWGEALPHSADAQRYTLQLLLALDRPGEIRAPLRALLRLTPVEPRNDLILALPQMVSRFSDKAAVLDSVGPVLQELTRHPANAAAAWTSLGRLQLSAQRGAEALESAQRAQAQNPKSPLPAWLALGLFEQQQEGAGALLQRLLQNLEHAAQQPVRFEFARLLIDQRQYEAAQQQLQQLVRQSPQQAEPWLLQGLLMLQLDREAEAAEAIERYLALPPANAEAGARGRTQAYLLLSQLAEKRGDFAGASAWLDRIEDRDALFAAQVRRAALLARTGKVDEARALLRQLPENGSDDARRKTLTEAHLLRDIGRHGEALQVYERAAQRYPEDADIAYERAMAAEKAGRRDEMERLLRELIERSPDYAHAYNALGYSLADRNENLPQARELILRALALTPDDPFIQDSLGWVEYRLGHVDEARQLLQRAYARRADPEIAAHLGEVLWNSGQRDAALKIWREGIALQPDNETLLRTLARFQVKP